MAKVGMGLDPEIYLSQEQKVRPSTWVGTTYYTTASMLLIAQYHNYNNNNYYYYDDDDGYSLIYHIPTMFVCGERKVA